MSEFDAKAAGWDSDPARTERARVLAEAIRAGVPLHPAMTALEVGCGTGTLSFFLQPYVGHITLADNSEGMLAVLRQKIAASGLPNMTSLNLDLERDPLPRERFDLLYNLMVLHHMDDTAAVLEKFHALLNPGGFLCIADLDLEDGSFHEGDFKGHPGFKRDKLSTLAAQAGFSEISFENPFVMKKQRDGRDKFYPLFLMLARK